MIVSFSARASARLRAGAGGLVLLACLLTLRPAHAQSADEVPVVTRTFAIENARVVQAPGRVLDRGTVIVRDGLITAVGADVAVPFDAERIAGDSLTVYAGFIDGLSHAGIPEPKQDADRPRVPNPGTPPNDVAGIQPERQATALLRAEGKALEALRKAGFTAAHVVPHGGMLPGAGAVVLLAGPTPEAMVLRDDVSLFAQYEPARGVYPATSMAIMAKLRQLYREADRRRTVERLYAENPAGLERPAFDPVHAAFFPVLAGERPVVFYTQGREGALEIHRTLMLREELGFPLILAGLNQAFLALDALRTADVPLLLTLDLPEAPDEPKGAAADSAAADTSKVMTPDAPGTFFVSDLRTRSYEDVARERENLEARQALTRERYAANAARLHEAGLRFGFMTMDVEPEDAHAHLRQMIAAGLPEEAALAALTTDGAAVLGLTEVLGTVEAGKIANLVVTKGSYFDEKPDVRYVFVDGRKFAYGAEAPAGPEADVAGTWSYTVWTPDGEVTGTLTLTGRGRRLGGTLASSVLSSPAPLEDVRLDGDELTFAVQTRPYGRLSARLTFTGDEMRGTVTVPEAGDLSIRGTRRPGR